MSNTIIFMRHGLRGPGGGLQKYEGIKQVERTADQLIKAEIRPDVIFCSLSPRTGETAEILLEKFRLAGVDVSVRADKRLEFGPITDILATLDNDVNTVIMVGHEESIYLVSQKLTMGSFAPHSGQAAVIECRNGSWELISKSRLNKIRRIFSPDPA
jgi:phosphohistidine phosphatase SixA